MTFDDALELSVRWIACMCAFYSRYENVDLFKEDIERWRALNSVSCFPTLVALALTSTETEFVHVIKEMIDSNLEMAEEAMK